MRTALDAPTEALDEYELKFVADIREHGWFRTNILAEDDQPGFAFTTGFWVSLGKPEIIVFNLKTSLAHNVLWDIYRDLERGHVFPVGTPTDDIFANIPACLIPVDKSAYPAHLGWSRWFYAGDDFPCLQLVWADREGAFPWEDGFAAEFEGLQPDLSAGDWGGLAKR